MADEVKVTIVTSGDERNGPDTPDLRYRSLEPAVQLCRDLSGGYAVMRARGATYLPRHPKEEWDNYVARLNRPVFFNAFSRTIDGLVGMVFRKDPVLGDDVPEQIRQHFEDIDNRGTHGAVFARSLFSCYSHDLS